MNWLTNILPGFGTANKADKKGVPEGVWYQCEACQSAIYGAEYIRNLCVCSKCGFHHKISARKRLEYFVDKDSQHEIGDNISGFDWLSFKDSKRYKERLSLAQKKTDEKEAIVTVNATLLNEPIVCCAFEFNFIGGSMGYAVGEKFVQAVSYAEKNNLPLICFIASGGARMQEGLLSLMQLAKTSAALARFHKQGLPYISVLTNPTTGGVSASIAMLGDIIIAEPNALIAFAGPRVIEQTVRQVLPEGFQKSEFLLDHGGIDMIIERAQHRDRIHNIINILHRR